MSLNLQAFISQRLIPTIDGKRCAAIEILLGTPRVCDLIKKGAIDEIKEVMLKSETQGMKTFDTALLELFNEGKIAYEEALKNADSKNNLALKIKLSGKKIPTKAPAVPEKKAPQQTAPQQANSSVAEQPAAVKNAPVITEKPSGSGGLSLQPMVEDKPQEDEV